MGVAYTAVEMWLLVKRTSSFIKGIILSEFDGVAEIVELFI